MSVAESVDLMTASWVARSTVAYRSAWLPIEVQPYVHKVDQMVGEVGYDESHQTEETMDARNLYHDLLGVSHQRED